ncbi:MAG: LamG-like jellyroll fold domain-containing protein, partial [Planctomycetota bacterium]
MATGFNSNGGELVIENDALDAIGRNNDDFSASMWVRPDGSPTSYFRPLLLKGDLSGGRLPAIWLAPNTNQLRVQVTNDQGTMYFVDTDTSLPSNAWSHVAVVKTENEVKVYIDGSLESTFAFFGRTEANSSPLYLGRFPGRQASVATFDDVAMLPQALTDFEVAQLFAATTSTLTSRSGTLSRGGNDGALPLNFTIETPPDVGTFELRSDGSYDFFGDYTGRASTSFSYVVSDGFHTRTQSGLITLRGKSSLQISPIADAAVLSSLPAEIFGNRERLDTRQVGGTQQYGLLKFDISRFSTEADRFLLELDLSTGPVADSVPDTNSLHQISSDWDESSVTYNNAPTLGDRLASWTPRTDSEIVIDVTDSVIDALQSRQTEISFAITSDTEGYFRYFSRESATVPKRPRLVVETDLIRPTASNRRIYMIEDTTRVLSLVDFSINNLSTGAATATIEGVTNGSLTLDGVAVTNGQSISAADIFAGKLEFTPEANLFGQDVARIEYSVAGLGDHIFGGYITISLSDTPDAPSVFAPRDITINEDEPRTLRWSDFEIADPDLTNPTRVLLADLPTLGAILQNGHRITTATTLEQSEFNAGEIVYVPNEGSAGVGVQTIGWQLMDYDARAYPAADMNFETLDLATVGLISVEVLDDTGLPVASAEPGDVITVNVRADHLGFAKTSFGGYLDLRYESSQLELVPGSFSIGNAFPNADDLFSIETGRIRNLGGFSDSQPADNLLATMEFEVVGMATSQIDLLRPSTDAYEPFFDDTDTSYRAGQVDYISASIEPATGMPASTGMPFDLWEFVDWSNPSDTTNDIATENHVVLRDVKDRNATTSPQSGSEGEFEDDLIYYRFSVVDDGLGGVPGQVYLKVSGSTKDRYDLVFLSQSGTFTDLPSMTGSEVVYYQIDTVDSSVSFTVGRVNNSAEREDRVDLNFTLVYQGADGEFIQDPPHGSGTPQRTTETGQIVDTEEKLVISAEKDAVEFGESGTPENGRVFINITDQTPLGFGGLGDYTSNDDDGTRYEVAEYSKENFLATDLRMIIEVPADSDVGTPIVQTGSATPGTDFGLKLIRHGKVFSDSRDTNPNDEHTEPVDLEISPAIRGGTGEFILKPADMLYYIVSDPGTPTNWIDVAGSGDAENVPITVYNELEVLVVPTNDAVSEGSETFTLYLEARQQPPATPVSTIGTDLTTYLGYGSTGVTINDDEFEPAFANQEVDGTCSCTCQGCLSGIPVNMMSGSVISTPSPPATTGAMLPRHFSPGSHSTDQTLRVSTPLQSERIPAGLEFTTTANGSISPFKPTLDLPATFEEDFELESPGEDPSIAVRLPVSISQDSASGIYSVTTDIRGYDAELTANPQQQWTASSLFLVNNIWHNNAFAPGWAFPSGTRVVTGIPVNGAGTGAALLRADQSASYYRPSGTGYLTPPETFEELSFSNGEFTVSHPDGAKQFFSPANGEAETYVDTPSGQDAYLMTASVSAAGDRTEFEYDDFDRLIKAIDPLGRETTYQWSEATNQRILTIIDHHGRETVMKSNFTVSPNAPINVVIEHVAPGASERLIETFDYSGNRIAQINSGGRVTTLSYRSLFAGSDPSLPLTYQRIAAITAPDGLRTEIDTIGIDDALPRDGSWIFGERLDNFVSDFNDDEQEELLGEVRPNEFVTGIFANRFDGLHAGNMDSGIGRYRIDALYIGDINSIPKRSLKSFENHASYTFLGGEDGPEDRTHSFTLDRRGRTLTHVDPLGNVTTLVREVILEEDTGLVLNNKGLKTTQTLPDPDRFASVAGAINGPLPRPEHSFTYFAQTPFVDTHTLPDVTPDVAGDTYVIDYGSYFNGLPSSVTDELGHERTFDVDTTPGLVTSITEELQATERLTWTNPENNYDVNGNRRISPLDALLILNQIRRWNRPNDEQPSSFDVRYQPGHFLDVNASGSVTPGDAGAVLSEIRRRNIAETGLDFIPEPKAHTKILYVGDANYEALSEGSGPGQIDLTTNLPNMQSLQGAVITPSRLEGTPDAITIFEYDLDDPADARHGQLVAIYRTTVTYTANGDPVVDYADALVTQFEYDANGFLTKTIDPVLRETEYQTDSAGRITQITSEDPDGASPGLTGGLLGRTLTRFTYNEHGEVFIQETDYSTFNVDSSGNTSIAQRTARTTNVFDQRGRVTAVIGPKFDPSSNYGSDTQDDQPITVLEGNTQILANIDTVGRPVTAFQYDVMGDLREVVTPSGENTSMMYDRNSRMLSLLEPQRDVVNTSDVGLSPQSRQRPASFFAPFSAGGMRASTDADGLVTEQTIDLWGRPIEVTTYRTAATPLRTTIYDYSRESAPIRGSYQQWRSVWTTFDGDSAIGIPVAGGFQETDPLSRPTEVSIWLGDQNGGVTGQVDPGLDDFSNTRYFYELDGMLAYTEQSVGSGFDPVTSAIRYDNLRRVHSVANGGTEVTQYAYNAASEVISITDATQVQTQMAYDGLGSLSEVAVITVGQPAPAERHRYAHDGLGQRIEHIAGEGTEMTRQRSIFDDLGRVTASISGDTIAGNTEVTRMSYDVDNRLLQLENPKGGITEFTYHAGGLTASREIKTATVGSNTKSVLREFDFDAVGKLIQSRDGNNRVIRYAYDGLHHPTDETWYDSPSSGNRGFGDRGSEVGTITYVYDVLGRLETATGAQAAGAFRTENSYDLGGRLIEQRQTADNSTESSNSETAVFNYNYFDNHAFQSTVLSDSGSMVYTDNRKIDAANRLTQVSRTLGGQLPFRVDFAYDDAGRLIEMDRSGTNVNPVSTFLYDSSGRIANIVHEDGNSNLISSYATVFDVAGRLTQTTSVDTVSGTPATLLRNYTYDSRGQLTDVTVDTSGGNVSLGIANLEDYNYDAGGNRTSNGSSADADNRLTADADWTYTYDDEGNL